MRISNQREIVDFTRLKEIVDGTIDAESELEVFFLAGYTAGSTGEALADFLIEIDPDALDREEFDHLIFGYSWGQKDLMFDEGDAIALMSKKTFH